MSSLTVQELITILEDLIYFTVDMDEYENSKYIRQAKIAIDKYYTEKATNVIS
jgi:hypothetical protein